MPVGDAVQKMPTLEEQVAQFKGFSTVDGEISNETQTPEEKTAAENHAAVDAQAAKAETDNAKTPKEDEAGNPAQSKPAKQDRSRDGRIGELTYNWRQAQRDLQSERDARARDKADFEARLSRIERGELTPPGSGAKSQHSDTEKPDPKDYEFGDLDVRYIEDRTRFAVRQELKADRDRTSQNQQREAAARKAQELTERKTALAEKGAAKYDDFNEVVLEGAEDGLWPLSQTMGELIFESDVGHEIAYHLASDPKEARRVAGLTDAQQAAYFGRLEAQFSSPADATTQASKPVVKVPKAPQPPENRARGGSGSAAASADTNDFAAFERMAMAPAR